MSEPITIASAIVDADPAEAKRVRFATPEKVVFVVQRESPSRSGTLLRGLLIAAAIVLLLIILLNVPVMSCLKGIAARAKSNFDGGGEDLEALRKDLAHAGWHLFTMPGCGFCEQQMDVLGGEYVEGYYHECGQDAVDIDCAGIDGFPHWKNEDGRTRTGLLSLEKLKSL
ncbi:MAG: hypothetical protein KGL39_24010 [Patescibacteria group bacterium]|nr:hypothetical protein [Patescibacteria group bacterium]